MIKTKACEKCGLAVLTLRSSRLRSHFIWTSPDQFLHKDNIGSALLNQPDMQKLSTAS